MTGRRVLLVSPAFHGYHATIAASLEARGHRVDTHVYDDHRSPTGRAWHHLRHELPHRTGLGRLRGLEREQTDRAVAALGETRPDAVVIVKGDTLGEDFWWRLNERHLPRVTWLYDEVRRTRFAPELLAMIGPLATYSPIDHADFDQQGWDSRCLPLAFDHRLVAHPPGLRTSEVTFVGARYPARERVLGRLIAAQVPVRAYGRDWSRHPVDRLRTWSVRRPGVPSGRDLDRGAAYRVMAGSTATLNLHGDQDGFTMRTFEAAGVGGVQLIDRADVGGLYDDGVELASYSSLTELVELCRRADADRAWANSMRAAARVRTLAEHTFDHRVAVLEASWDTA